MTRRERPPWRPQRGQYARLWPAAITIPEWAGFTLVVAVAAAVLIAALVAL